MKPMLLALIKKLLDTPQELLRQARRLTNSAGVRGSVKTDTEAEKQAYQEEKREHLGG